MARPGWLDENRTRAYPFVANTVGVPIDGTPTVRNLTFDAIVDAGFVAGPGSSYASLGDYIYLNRVWRADNRFYFEFLTTALGLLNKPLVFSRNLSSDEFVTSFEDLTRIEAENSASVSDDPCDDTLEWNGFITTGSLDALALLMDDGDVWLNAGSYGKLEPATVQNLNTLIVQSVSIANADRTQPLSGTECGDAANYDPGMVRPWQECLLGRLLFKPGYNVTIEQDTTNNAITFRPAVGEGAGEPCGEVPTYPAEGEEGDDLSGSLRCRDVLRSINGQGGSVFGVEANAGFSVIADPKNNRLVIDANFANMEACIAGVSQSAFVPDPDVPPSPATTTTTTEAPVAPLWLPTDSPFPLACWLKPETLNDMYPSDGEVMSMGWYDGLFGLHNAEVANPSFPPFSYQNVINGYNVMRRVNTQGLKFSNLLAQSGGTFSTYMFVRPGNITEGMSAFMDTVNRQWSVFSPTSRTSVGGVTTLSGVGMTPGEWALVSLECAGPSGLYSIRINGNLAYLGTAGNGFFDQLVLGLNPSGDGESSPITEYVEFSAWFAVLPSSERAKQEGYIAWKFNKASLLPPDHPYRFAPPRV